MLHASDWRRWLAAAGVAALSAALPAGCAGVEDVPIDPDAAGFAIHPAVTAHEGKPAASSDVEPMKRLAANDHITLLERCVERADEIANTYTCTLIKQERIGGRLRAEQVVSVWARRRPFSVAMHWEENPSQADRALYVEGKYNGHMLARPTNPLFRRFVPNGTAVVEPDGPEAMQHTLRPITQFGFLRSLESLLSAYRKGKASGRLEQGYGGLAEVDGRAALVLLRRMPLTDGGPDSKTFTYIDVTRWIPLGTETYTFDDDGKLRLQHRYLYTDIEFDVGLSDSDFRPEAHDMADPDQ